MISFFRVLCLLLVSLSSFCFSRFYGYNVDGYSLNTLPGVSTHEYSLVVVVCEHGVSPALKDPEVSLPKTTLFVSSLSFQDRGHSLSLPPRSNLFPPSNCAVSFVISLEECLRSRDLVAALTIF